MRNEVAVLSSCIKEFKKGCKEQGIPIKKESVIGVGSIPEVTIFSYNEKYKEDVLYEVKFAYEMVIEKLTDKKLR